MIESAVHWLLSYLAIPEVGLTSVFLISFISATLLPLGSEPAVFAVVAADKSLFWQVMAVAAAGNTLGGILNYWIGFGAKKRLPRKGKPDGSAGLKNMAPKQCCWDGCQESAIRFARWRVG